MGEDAMCEVAFAEGVTVESSLPMASVSQSMIDFPKRAGEIFLPNMDNACLSWSEYMDACDSTSKIANELIQEVSHLSHGYKCYPSKDLR